MFNKKAQAWGVDLIIALSIFITAALVLMIYSYNSLSENEETYTQLKERGEIIMEKILNQGIPEDWNTSNVIEIGLVSSGKIDNKKLEDFYNLSLTDYKRTKEIFNTQYNYFVNFSETIEINDEQIEGIGKINLSSNNLVRITRVVLFEDKPSTINLYIWE